jgi:hypothetical protein
MTATNGLFLGIVVLSVGFFAYNVQRLIGYLRIGRLEPHVASAGRPNNHVRPGRSELHPDYHGSDAEQGRRLALLGLHGQRVELDTTQLDPIAVNLVRMGLHTRRKRLEEGGDSTGRLGGIPMSLERIEKAEAGALRKVTKLPDLHRDARHNDVESWEYAPFLQPLQLKVDGPGRTPDPSPAGRRVVSDRGEHGRFTHRR